MGGIYLKSIMLAALVLGFVLGTAAIATADLTSNNVNAFMPGYLSPDWHLNHANQVIDKNVPYCRCLHPRCQN